MTKLSRRVILAASAAGSVATVAATAKAGRTNRLVRETIRPANAIAAKAKVPGSGTAPVAQGSVLAAAPGWAAV